MTRPELEKYRSAMEKGAKHLTDTEALDVPKLFPSWEIGHTYATGDRFEWSDKLYKVIQPHTSQADWTPDVATSLYTEVGKPEQGDTPDNPIPYNNNMELVKDKYYSQNDVVYLCFRDTEIPVYNDLADLVHIYVEVYEGGEGE